MKKVLLATVLLALTMIAPVSLQAEVNVSIGFSLPGAVAFEGPPDVIVLPDTDNVYVVPDRDEDIFFWNGWWWRPWEGRWYRSHSYNRGWAYYNKVPRFYYDLDPGWRGYYRDRNWSGHQWNYQRIPTQQLNRNWKKWRTDRYWERNKTWGVESYQPRPHQQIQELRNQRQEQYRQRPEVQRYQQQIQERQKRPQVEHQQRQVQKHQKQHQKQKQKQKQQKHEHKDWQQRGEQHQQSHGKNREK